MGTQHFSMISKLNKLDSFFHVRFRNEANRRCNLWLPNKVSVFLREEPSHKQGQMGFPIHPRLATNSWSQDTPWSAHPAIENLPVAEWRSWSWATPPPWHFPRGEFPSTQSPQFLGSLVASVAIDRAKRLSSAKTGHPEEVTLSHAPARTAGNSWAAATSNTLGSGVVPEGCNMRSSASMSPWQIRARAKVRCVEDWCKDAREPLSRQALILANGSKKPRSNTGTMYGKFRCNKTRDMRLRKKSKASKGKQWFGVIGSQT